MFMKLIGGGLLKGQRTYILGGLLAAQAVAGYFVGDMSLPTLMSQLPELLGGLGLITLRAGVSANGPV